MNFYFCLKGEDCVMSQSSHYLLPLLVCMCLFSGSVSLFLFCRQDHLYHFSRFHIYALIYDICFALSDLFHSVWQFLGPPTSLQMTQFCSLLWLSNIPLCVCVYMYTHTLGIDIYICMCVCILGIDIYVCLCVCV